MPNRTDEKETATLHGALDSDFITQQTAGSAHLVREVVRDNNRQYSSGGPIFSCQWSANTDYQEGALGAMVDYATWPLWNRLWPVPIPVPHQTQLRRAYVDVGPRACTPSNPRCHPWPVVPICRYQRAPLVIRAQG